MAGTAANGAYWDTWYAKNKARLAEKRAKRYQEDTGYRDAALRRSRAQRERQAKKAGGQKVEHLIAFPEAAQALDVSTWVLREWRRKDYFPEPKRRENRLWFTPAQVKELKKLKTFFDTHGVRVAEANRAKLETVSKLIYANW